SSEYFEGRGTGTSFPQTTVWFQGVRLEGGTSVHGVNDRLDETTTSTRPAWEPIPMETDDTYWAPFQQRFAFRPGMRSWPAIEEPRPSVTVDLAPIFAGSHAQFAAGADAINSLALLALTRVLDPDSSLVVLDWQHQTYRFWPHQFACQSDQQWPTTVFPNGDYYIFLTEDMSTGTFGHPWEQTLCVFGEHLVSALVPTLTSWLAVKRSNRWQESAPPRRAPFD
ncbi:DUF2716 domain-containing protein, partial [Actinoplanes sp. NPDC049599]|uniref:DUF2716 domain-containing protein n=1 Tax=Actinoplanes sp. NPDC049599 TaxID=3363903 RepID=UPI003787EDD1